MSETLSTSQIAEVLKEAFYDDYPPTDVDLRLHPQKANFEIVNGYGINIGDEEFTKKVTLKGLAERHEDLAKIDEGRLYKALVFLVVGAWDSLPNELKIKEPLSRLEETMSELRERFKITKPATFEDGKAP